MQKTRTRLIIRADASPRIGTGHIMRCLALAQWAKAEGITVTLISRASVAWVRNKILCAGIVFHPLDGDAPLFENPRDLLEQIGSAGPGDWVVLDGYHFGFDCQKAVRAAGQKLLVIDDYRHLPEYSCDILLNQNIGAEEIKYVGDIHKKLLGVHFALLRPEFAAARNRIGKRDFSATVRNVLLTLGGGDFSDYLKTITHYFSIPFMGECTLRIIAGAMPHGRIDELLQRCSSQIEILSNVDDMSTLLLDTDLCITAGGSTCWELCCLGVPFLTLEVAENQNAVIKEMAKRNVALPLSHINLQRFLLEFEVRRNWAMRNMDLVDGTGPTAILSYIKLLA